MEKTKRTRIKNASRKCFSTSTDANIAIKDGKKRRTRNILRKYNMLD